MSHEFPEFVHPATFVLIFYEALNFKLLAVWGRARLCGDLLSEKIDEVCLVARWEGVIGTLEQVVVLKSLDLLRFLEGDGRIADHVILRHVH